MKAWDLAEEWRRIFAADTEAFPVGTLNFRTEQDAAPGVKPLATFSVSTMPIDGTGRYLSYQLLLAIESNPNDNKATADADHAGRVSAVQRKLFGATAGGVAAAKAAITQAFADGGKFTLRGYDAPGDPVDPAVETSRFRTILAIHGIAVVTGEI